MPVVLVPTAYRAPTRGVGEVPVEGATVIDCLLAVEAQYPGFRELVLDDDGRLHRFVRLFVNGESLDRKNLDQPLAAEDRLEVLAAIAGG